MRTTIDVDDKLFRRVKIAAASRGVPLKKLVEKGLEMVLQADESPKRTRVKLPLFGSKSGRVINVPEDIAHRAQLAEDLERHAASCRR